MRVIIFTQGHADHIGGWSELKGPETETIAQANHADRPRILAAAAALLFAANREAVEASDVTNVDRTYQPPEPVLTATFVDSHSFTLGDRRFELYSTPGGETTDSLVAWLPDERTVFTGNLMGPLFGHVPNLYTVRGDKIRSARLFINSVDRVIGLGPDLLITGHGEPVRGADEIRSRLTQIRDATEYLLDRTIEGMNAGTDLWTLMGQITLPPELDIPQGHGKVPWIVRAIWEEHVGWFRFESTTELYNVPPSAIWAELTVLAGGTPALVRAAQTHLDAGRPLHALNFVDMILTTGAEGPRCLGNQDWGARAAPCGEWPRELQRGSLAGVRDPRHQGARKNKLTPQHTSQVDPAPAIGLDRLDRFEGLCAESSSEVTIARALTPGTAVSRRYRFEGTVGTVVGDSVPWWPEAPRPPARAPNIVMVVLDDVGFAQLGCYGRGYRHPGHRSVGGARCSVPQFSRHGPLLSDVRVSVDRAQPSCRRHGVGRQHGQRLSRLSRIRLPRGHDHRRATGRRRLRHLLRREMASGSSSGDGPAWPVRPLAAGTRVRSLLRVPARYDRPVDAEPVGGQPFGRSNQGCGLSPFRGPGRSLPRVSAGLPLGQFQTGPFFMYLAFGAGHNPHQVPRPYIERYAGRFDDGWDAARDRILARQIAAGVVPGDTRMPPPNPDVPPWDSLGGDERRLFARMEEVFAGFLTHADEQLGRLVDFLEAHSLIDDTMLIVLSDNGASSEGGRFGYVSPPHRSGRFPALADNLGQVDLLGGPLTANHYPSGWAQAGNTPLRYYKMHTHGGGIRAPLIIHWPARLTHREVIGDQYHHAVDIVPTILEELGLSVPDEFRGVPQLPLHGTSMAYTFDDPQAPTRKDRQYYEIHGHRGLWNEGWKAVTYHHPGTPFADDRWELYHIEEDFSESTDLADIHPDKVDELVARWWVEAGANAVLPLEERTVTLSGNPNAEPRADKYTFTYLPGAFLPDTAMCPDLFNRSFRISAVVDAFEGAHNGLLLAIGDRFAGFSFFVQDGHLVFDYNASRNHSIITTSSRFPRCDAARGRHRGYRPSQRRCDVLR